ncbi:MAG: thiamine-monophosphate kinase [Dehalococcoidia bacterium]|nr:thiamine-monophosphate kinase [Dehalococcoidia bacterium]
MKVSELGEFALIDLIKRTIEQSQNRDILSRQQVVTGIGDDAAVWRSRHGLALATTDTLVENVHFRRGMGTWEDVGWKALAVSLSDIAAMGGLAGYALISLAMPPSANVEEITALYRGITELANKHDTALVGGNITRASELSITSTVVGSSSGNEVLRRSTARPGDLIAITGHTGLAAAGLRMLTRHQSTDRDTQTVLRNACLRPQPRLAEGQVLLKHGVRTAIDISDGLLSDLTQICRASRLGARVEISKLPIHPALKQAFPLVALELILSGGEDYELLFTADKDVIERVAKEIPVTAIGEMTSGRGDVYLVDDRGRILSPARRGWEHFKS